MFAASTNAGQVIHTCAHPRPKSDEKTEEIRTKAKKDMLSVSLHALSALLLSDHKCSL